MQRIKLDLVKSHSRERDCKEKELQKWWKTENWEHAKEINFEPENIQSFLKT